MLSLYLGIWDYSSQNKKMAIPVMVGDVKLREKGEGAVYSSVAKVHIYWKENSGQDHCCATLFGFNHCT